MENKNSFYRSGVNLTSNKAWPCRAIVRLTPDLYALQRGFTLIELLVVVLIIGILAAVALPQYQKAVEKSRATQAITLVRNVYGAAKAYQLANSEWPTYFDALGIDIPWSGTELWVYGGEGKSNENWSIQLQNSSDTSKGKGVIAGRLSGPYRGAAFAIYAVAPTSANPNESVPTEEIVCMEGSSSNHAIHFSKTAGDYCTKLFGGTLIPTWHATRYYKLK